jgi:hypothetical protein
MKKSGTTDARGLTALAGAGLVLLTAGTLAVVSVVAHLPKLDLSGGPQVSVPSLSAPGAISLPGFDGVEEADPVENDASAPIETDVLGPVVSVATAVIDVADKTETTPKAGSAPSRDHHKSDAPDKSRDARRFVRWGDRGSWPVATDHEGGGPGNSSVHGYGKPSKPAKPAKPKKMQPAKAHPSVSAKVHGKHDDEDEVGGDDEDDHGHSKAKGHSEDRSNDSNGSANGHD